MRRNYSTHHGSTCGYNKLPPPDSHISSEKVFYASRKFCFVFRISDGFIYIHAYYTLHMALQLWQNISNTQTQDHSIITIAFIFFDFREVSLIINAIDWKRYSLNVSSPNKTNKKLWKISFINVHSSILSWRAAKKTPEITSDSI